MQCLDRWRNETRYCVAMVTLSKYGDRSISLQTEPQRIQMLRGRHETGQRKLEPKN